MPPPPAPAKRSFHNQRAHDMPTEHDEEKGKERGKYWLWEGAQSSRAAPRERVIHSDRFTGQCTSRHTTSLLTDGHGTAAVDRTNPPHSRRETEVPPGGSNGFALASGCRRGEGFLWAKSAPPKIDGPLGNWHGIISRSSRLSSALHERPDRDQKASAASWKLS